MGATAVEKILARAAGKSSVRPGDVIYPKPDYVILHDMHAHVFFRELWEMGLKSLWDPDRIIVVMDHQVPAVTTKMAETHKEIRDWVQRYALRHFFDVGNSGITHQLQIERGFARPGTLIVSKDVHSPNAGAVGSLAIPFIYDVPTFMALGSGWVRVPEVIRVDLTGKAGPGVLARDVAQVVSAEIGYERCDYRVVEWGGEYVGCLGIDGRQVLCNVAIEVSAKSAFVNPDAKACDYVRRLTDIPFEPISSDPDADYALTLDFDIATLEPQVARPPSPENVVPVSVVAGTPIHHAFIGSCAGGMLDDLRHAARILKGRKLSPGVRMIVSPSTQRIFQQALLEGLIEIFSDAGAAVIPGSCSACPGFLFPLADGERTMATATRNEPGRMGSHEAEIYLGNPMTVAASAVNGRITDPREFLS